MFKYTKRLIAEIRFQLGELKWGKKEEEEISQVEGFSGHGSMDGFRIHKIFEAQRAERLRLHMKRLAAIH
ncbi:MAG: hypothetical protein IJS05_09135 [Paludibacteraceae bacterium]|nr:hypothetical protein [Paludibacteraceae bacterium]